VDVLLLDPFGTGDSAGEFSEARWETWRDDIARAVAWLGARTDGQVGLWGLRLGAILATDVAAADPDRIACLVFWQPVLSGDRHMTQFLRLRVAAAMDRDSDRETTKALRERLSRGETLEIAGYQLAPALADSIASLQLQSHVHRLGRLPIFWLEVATEQTATLSDTSQRIVTALEQQGHPLSVKTVSGDPFWTAQETTLAPHLLQATDDLFRS
jgi:exosortase A-associated hydrolase 2